MSGSQALVYAMLVDGEYRNRAHRGGRDQRRTPRTPIIRYFTG